MSDEFYLPPIERIQAQSKDNKQASGEPLSIEDAEKIRDLLSQSYKQAYQSYEACLKYGLSREIARIQLPLANYTELFWKINLHNFFHYTRLRSDKDHAQNEIVQLSNIMYNQVKRHVPISCQAFEDFVQNSISFSEPEQQVLSRLLRDPVSLDSVISDGDHALSKREINELRKKIFTIME